MSGTRNIFKDSKSQKQTWWINEGRRNTCFWRKNWICYFDFIHDAFWPLEHLKFSLCMHLAKNLRHNPNHKKLRIKHLSFCAPSGIFKLCNRSFSFLWIHIKSYDLCYSGAGWRCRGFEIYWVYHYYIWKVTFCPLISLVNTHNIITCVIPKLDGSAKVYWVYHYYIGKVSAVSMHFPFIFRRNKRAT